MQRVRRGKDIFFLLISWIIKNIMQREIKIPGISIKEVKIS
ncbi:hypothetical protein [Petrotoga olearia]|uniref:Uncharacterized protein n=1 Tax=Petrotoga olearia DSM 13574 TaxID=1122955 RepID=A0A2K1P063_9BACT|nr:hypothetical protein [Petrotoga olearia]PNR96171.1 hypothetical protein X929_06125 [Petrotoga olearia DSM 13574]